MIYVQCNASIILNAKGFFCNFVGAPFDDPLNEQTPLINDKKELDCLIEEILEQTQHGKWKCKVCSKISAQRHQAKNHAETHIQGLSYPCLLCRKTCSTKQNLSAHISNVHSGVFSCNICDKTDMNRKEYHNHKRTHLTKNKNWYTFSLNEISAWLQYSI